MIVNNYWWLFYDYYCEIIIYVNDYLLLAIIGNYFMIIDDYFVIINDYFMIIDDYWWLLLWDYYLCK